MRQIIAAIVIAAIALPVYSVAAVPLRAEVAKITPLDFPYVRLGLSAVRSQDGSALPRTGNTLTVTPAYSLNRDGSVDFTDRATIDNIEAFYLKPGDKIEAYLLDSRKPDGTFYVTRITRLTTEPPVTAQPISGVRTDKQNYELGETVKITFIIENPTQQDVTFRFSSGQKYDIWVVGDTGEIWRWSRGKAFTQAFTSLTLKPGERRTFEEAWNQTSNQGNQAAPGTYSIFAQLTTIQPRPTPVRTQITIGKGQAVVRQMTIGSIVSNVDTALGQMVQISGTFLGWRPDPYAPACKQGPPVTRSDWAISDQTGCIFVTGRSGLDPTDDYGKNITVSGIVRKTERGQPYIEARTVILNPPG